VLISVLFLARRDVTSLTNGSALSFSRLAPGYSTSLSKLQALETLHHNFVESFDFCSKLLALKTSVTTLLSQIT
jgi:hypothetical protein